jgi:hypothetical protein
MTAVFRLSVLNAFFTALQKLELTQISIDKIPFFALLQRNDGEPKRNVIPMQMGISFLGNESQKKTLKCIC